MSVADRDGNHEDRVEQIIVKNDTASTVLPRTESGLKLSSLRFDGHRAVLRDSGGNEISAQAVSGLRANNAHNIEHKDFTGPSHQDDGNRGPIPAGKYHIVGGAAQMPEIVKGKLKYPSGSTPFGWGPFRVPLVRGRSVQDVRSQRVLLPPRPQERRHGRLHRHPDGGRGQVQPDDGADPAGPARRAPLRRSRLLVVVCETARPLAALAFVPSHDCTAPRPFGSSLRPRGRSARYAVHKRTCRNVPRRRFVHVHS